MLEKREPKIKSEGTEQVFIRERAHEGSHLEGCLVYTNGDASHLNGHALQQAALQWYDGRLTGRHLAIEGRDGFEAMDGGRSEMRGPPSAKAFL